MMKRYMYYILVLLLLFTITACNESSKSSQEAIESENFNVSVTLPEQKSKETNKFFKTASEIQSIFLVVIDNHGNENSHKMSYDGTTDTWSVNFSLSRANGPFTFRADAYAASSPAETDIPIFTGEVVFDPGENTETNITIPLAETEVNVNTRVLPSLTSIEEGEVNDTGTVLYTFNVVNKQGGVLKYSVDSVNTNDGTHCLQPFFNYIDENITSINFDQVSGDSSSFNLTYTPNDTCTNPTHTLILTVAETQDSIRVPIVVNDQSFHISIAFPPVIESIDVTQLEDSYRLKVNVEKRPSDINLGYEWSLAQGTGTLSNETTETVDVTGYNPNIGLALKVKVTNSDSGASTSFVYTVLEKVLVKKDDGTIFDESTGLVWAKDEEVSGLLSWYFGKGYCEDLNTNDPLYDWRLPTIAELEDVYPNDIFSYSQYLWSVNNHETDKELATDDDINEAWYILGNSGAVAFGGDTGNVRCVSETSATQSNVQSKVKKTGQTSSYNEAGDVVDNSLLPDNEKIKDDGFYQKGVTPSYTRDDTTQTVTDNVTGLVWQYYNDYNRVDGDWEAAKLHCKAKNIPTDVGWRLPTRKELQGLVDYGKVRPAINGAFNMSGLVLFNYWTSTTRANDNESAWVVDFVHGIQY